MKHEIDGHAIEFSNGSSSLDPWTSEYCRKIGLSCWATSDIVPYVRIDGEKIYRLRSSNKSLDMRQALMDGAVSSFDEFLFFFSEFFEREHEDYSESVRIHNKRKKREDEWEALPKEEKDRQMAEWRTERAERLKKMKEEKS